MWLGNTVTSEIGFRLKRTAESFPPRAKAIYTELMQIWLNVMVEVREKSSFSLQYQAVLYGIYTAVTDSKFAIKFHAWRVVLATTITTSSHTNSFSDS